MFPRWWRESWLASGWDARLWTDRDIFDFFITQSRDIRLAMKEYPCGVMRSDAFRYLLLKHFGGLYVDLDFVCLTSLDWISAMECFACGDQGDGQGIGRLFVEDIRRVAGGAGQDAGGGRIAIAGGMDGVTDCLVQGLDQTAKLADVEKDPAQGVILRLP